MANILLIDPNVALARTYIQALQHVGHNVVHVTNGQEAIDEADVTMPDIVILELQLGAHDGVEFLHEFRSYAEWLAIPVVVVTVITPAALLPVQKALEGDLGVVACLYKPRTSLQQLIGAVNEQIAHV